MGQAKPKMSAQPLEIFLFVSRGLHVSELLSEIECNGQLDSKHKMELENSSRMATTSVNGFSIKPTG
jgi:hypothetical protein